MTSSLMTPKVQPVALRTWIVCVLFGVAAAAGTWIFVSALINAPAARAMIERQNAEEIVQENRAFCTRFGMAPDTPAFSTCANELAQIRQRQEDRWKRDFDLF
jgi:hypothetical protein